MKRVTVSLMLFCEVAFYGLLLIIAGIGFGLIPEGTDPFTRGVQWTVMTGAILVGGAWLLSMERKGNAEEV